MHSHSKARQQTRYEQQESKCNAIITSHSYIPPSFTQSIGTCIEPYKKSVELDKITTVRQNTAHGLYHAYKQLVNIGVYPENGKIGSTKPALNWDQCELRQNQTLKNNPDSFSHLTTIDTQLCDKNPELITHDDYIVKTITHFLEGAIPNEDVDTKTFPKSIQYDRKLDAVNQFFISPNSTLISFTTVEGFVIACFEVGGEKRLCLPQILNTVLKDFTLIDINAACDALHIYCSRCNDKQLAALKQFFIISYVATDCGLITKSDSERLCDYLLRDGHQHISNENRQIDDHYSSYFQSKRLKLSSNEIVPQKLISPTNDSKHLIYEFHDEHSSSTITDVNNVDSSNLNYLKSNHGSRKKEPLVDSGIVAESTHVSSNSNNLCSNDYSFTIFHECFGRCVGTVFPKLYVAPATPCIQCTHCKLLLSPQQFVCHSHRKAEKRVCHWGFDSERWRCYILPVYHCCNLTDKGLFSRHPTISRIDKQGNTTSLSSPNASHSNILLSQPNTFKRSYSKFNTINLDENELLKNTDANDSLQTPNEIDKKLLEFKLKFLENDFKNISFHDLNVGVVKDPDINSKFANFTPIHTNGPKKDFHAFKRDTSYTAKNCSYSHESYEKLDMMNSSYTVNQHKSSTNNTVTESTNDNKKHLIKTEKIENDNCDNTRDKKLKSIPKYLLKPAGSKKVTKHSSPPILQSSLTESALEPKNLVEEQPPPYVPFELVYAKNHEFLSDGEQHKKSDINYCKNLPIQTNNQTITTKPMINISTSTNTVDNNTNVYQNFLCPSDVFAFPQQCMLPSYLTPFLHQSLQSMPSNDNTLNFNPFLFPNHPFQSLMNNNIPMSSMIYPGFASQSLFPFCATNFMNPLSALSNNHLDNNIKLEQYLIQALLENYNKKNETLVPLDYKANSHSNKISESFQQKHEDIESIKPTLDCLKFQSANEITSCLNLDVHSSPPENLALKESTSLNALSLITNPPSQSLSLNSTSSNFSQSTDHSNLILSQQPTSTAISTISPKNEKVILPISLTTLFNELKADTLFHISQVIPLTSFPGSTLKLLDNLFKGYQHKLEDLVLTLLKNKINDDDFKDRYEM